MTLLGCPFLFSLLALGLTQDLAAANRTSTGDFAAFGQLLDAGSAPDQEYEIVVPKPAEQECHSANRADPPDEDKNFIRTTYFCNKDGQLIRRSEIFVKTGTLSNETIYDSLERKVRYRIWDLSEKQTGSFTYEYLNNGTYIVTDRDLLRHQPRGKQQFKPQPGKHLLLRRWHYSVEKEEQGPAVLTHSDLYTYAPSSTQERVKVRWLYDNRGTETEVVVFEYDPKGTPDSRPISFEVYDVDGHLVRSYSSERTLTEALDLRAIYRANGESDMAIERRLAKVNAPGRIAVAMLDTGFDVFNPHLADKMWRNTLDPVDGNDNDGDDWASVVMGWDLERQRAIPLERIDVPRQGGTPMSHGSHTGSSAVEDLDYAAIIGFAGDFTNPKHLERVALFLAKNGIRFANMSFGIPNMESVYGVINSAYGPLDNLIAKNPQTLFVAAAGNDYRDIDDGQPIYPASFTHENLIVVGSLAADSLDENGFSFYKMSEFSNRGIVNVDILAPGEGVLAADLGGGLVRHSGTSMASPMLLRLGVLPLAREHPDLGALQIKELLLKTAYIPNLENPFPVRSGGIVFPSRALAAAALMKKEPSLGVQSAALAVRENPALVKPGEGSDPEYLERLRLFWRSRGL